MIDHITLETFKEEQGDIIFPNLHITAGEEYFTICTFINVDEYLISYKKRIYIGAQILDYVQLSKFLDSIMIDVNKIKTNYKIDTLCESKTIRCYKIIE